MLCENGAAIYDLAKNQYIYSVESVDLNTVRSDLIKITNQQISFEPGKDFSLSFRISCLSPSSAIEDEFTFIKSELTLPGELMMTHSSSALDIVPKLASKGKSIDWFLKQSALKASETFGFGDAANDLSFLKILGTTGAPSNSSQIVKSTVDYVSEYENIEGLIDFINTKVI